MGTSGQKFVHKRSRGLCLDLKEARKERVSGGGLSQCTCAVRLPFSNTVCAPKSAQHCQIASFCFKRPLKTTFDMTTLIFSTGGCPSYPFYPFKRGPWYLFLWVLTENPSREVATKDHLSSNPRKGNPPDLKTKVDASKVDVKGFPIVVPSRSPKKSRGTMKGGSYLAHRNRSDFCDLRLRRPSEDPRNCSDFRDKRKRCCIAI